MPAEILLIDDSSDNLNLYQLFLKKGGWPVDHASSGEEALGHVLVSEYRFILLDLELPGMDGYETVRHIRESEKDQNKSPASIVATSAHPAREVEAICLEAGFDRFLQKPFTKAKLLETVQEAMSITRET